MVMAIVGDEDAGRVVEALKGRGYKLTRLSSSSGFLMMSNTVLLIGVEDAQVDDVLSIIHANCRRRSEFIPPPPSERAGVPPRRPSANQEVEVGGAVVFVLDVRRYERL